MFKKIVNCFTAALLTMLQTEKNNVTARNRKFYVSAETQNSYFGRTLTTKQGRKRGDFPPFSQLRKNVEDSKK